MRFFLALLLGKITKLLSTLLHRLLHREGTNLPGQVALRICPDFLGKVAKPGAIVAVTGTNGKTTLTNLLSDLLEKEGYRVLSNRFGSNINSGIATTLLNGVSLFNKSRYHGEKAIAVLEIDERSSRRIYPYVRPDLVVATNLLRDSCRRNAHPHYIFDFINSALPEGVKLILNSDDLISCRLKEENPRVYYDIARQEGDRSSERNLVNDMQVCPRCHHKLSYEYIRYNHIGKAHCPECGLSSPKGDFRALSWDVEGKRLRVAERGEESEYPLISDSIFNIYNEMAAIAVLRELGLSREQVARALSGAHIVDSRFFVEEVKGVKIVAQMAKGQIAPALSVAFDYASSLPGDKRLVLFLEDIREGETSSENLAYLYDSDFEFLAKPDIKRIVLYGKRPLDMRLRLLLAGVAQDRIRICKTLEEIPGALGTEEGETVCVLYDNYSVTTEEKTREYLRAYLESEGPIRKKKGGEEA